MTKKLKRVWFGLAFKDGRTDFVKRHVKELSAIQRKYVDAMEKTERKKKEILALKDSLLELYKEGKINELNESLKVLNEELRAGIVRQVYESRRFRVCRKVSRNDYA